MVVPEWEVREAEAEDEADRAKDRERWELADRFDEQLGGLSLDEAREKLAVLKVSGDGTPKEIVDLEFLIEFWEDRFMRLRD